MVVEDQLEKIHHDLKKTFQEYVFLRNLGKEKLQIELLIAMI